MPKNKIAENKVKTTITMEKTLKAELEKFAKEDMRSFNNIMVSILTDYVVKRNGG